MNATRFDALARALAGRRSRRAALGGAGAGLAAGVLGALGLGHGRAAQDATPDGGGTPPAGAAARTYFLFVQTADAGSFTPNPSAGTPVTDAGTPTPGGGADYLLTLEGHHGETIYFSDRPARVFGEAPTERFLAGLGFTPANPPNAALVTQTDAGDDVVVLELLNPTYDAATGTLTYGATILAEYQGEGLAHVAAQQVDEELPETFGRASLFIDDCNDLDGCYHRPAGARTDRYVGTIPGGPFGRCWNWGDFCCDLCSGMDFDAAKEEYARRCNSAYPECANLCYVILGCPE